MKCILIVIFIFPVISCILRTFTEKLAFKSAHKLRWKFLESRLLDFESNHRFSFLYTNFQNFMSGY